MKYSSRGFSKKKLFPTAVRTTNKDGRRVWSLDGKEYPTLRSIIVQSIEEHAKKKTDKEKPLTKMQ